jgi:hypothetical protein
MCGCNYFGHVTGEILFYICTTALYRKTPCTVVVIFVKPTAMFMKECFAGIFVKERETLSLFLVAITLDTGRFVVHELQHINKHCFL